MARELPENKMAMGCEKAAEEIVHEPTLLGLLEVKTKMEADGKMTEGLAACFRHALEMVRKNEDIFYDCRLHIQADGNFLTFSSKSKYEAHIIWYDQYKKTVEEKHVFDP